MNKVIIKTLIMNFEQSVNKVNTFISNIDDLIIMASLVNLGF